MRKRERKLMKECQYFLLTFGKAELMPTTLELMKHPPARPPEQFLTRGSSRREGSSGLSTDPGSAACGGLQWWFIGRSVLNFISFVCYTLQSSNVGKTKLQSLTWLILLQWNLLEKDGQRVRLN